MIEMRWVVTVTNLRSGPVRRLQYRQRPDMYVVPEDWPDDQEYVFPWGEWQDILEVMIPRKKK